MQLPGVPERWAPAQIARRNRRWPERLSWGIRLTMSDIHNSHENQKRIQILDYSFASPRCSSLDLPTACRWWLLGMDSSPALPYFSRPAIVNEKFVIFLRFGCLLMFRCDACVYKQLLDVADLRWNLYFCCGAARHYECYPDRSSVQQSKCHIVRPWRSIN